MHASFIDLFIIVMYLYDLFGQLLVFFYLLYLFI